MLYKTQLDENTVKDSYEYVESVLCKIVDKKHIIGPIIDMINIDISQIQLIENILPNIKKYTVAKKSSDVSILFGMKHIFYVAEEFDFVEMYFSPRGSVRLIINNPISNCSYVNIDFISSFNSDEILKRLTALFMMGRKSV